MAMARILILTPPSPFLCRRQKQSAALTACGGLVLTVGRLGLSYPFLALFLLASFAFLYRFFAFGIAAVNERCEPFRCIAFYRMIHTKERTPISFGNSRRKRYFGVVNFARLHIELCERCVRPVEISNLFRIFNKFFSVLEYGV